MIPGHHRPDSRLRPRPGNSRGERTAAHVFCEALTVRTDPDDTVPDIFAGSNTTGSAAEKLDRRWLAFERDRTYLAASALRFVDQLPAEELATLWNQLHSEALLVAVNRQQKELVLMEKSAAYAARRKRR